MGESLVSDPIQRLKAYIDWNTKDIVWPDKVEGEPDLDNAVDRFGIARSSRADRLLGPDEIVLLRQVIRWSEMSDIRVDRPSGQYKEMNEWLKSAGTIWSPGGYLSAVPYAPNWLHEELRIMDNRPRKRSIDESFSAEPYLFQNLGFEKWLSPAQKEAVWLVMNAQKGSTCTVYLPTGCGKSSCFWLLPTFTSGLTLVVVPTIALAIDQQQSALKRYKHFPGVNPCFFASDDNPEITVAKVRNKESRLIFASPETCVSGHLRPVLDVFARDGWFQNLVIDEAHLIETWGAQFRVEFQILAATRQKWLKSSRSRLRTFLFSATMSPECKKTLSDMFAEQNNAQEFACQRLRPEMTYFSHRFLDDEERWPNLREAVWQFPRPAILYMTRPDDAEKLYYKLQTKEGFRRIGCFTGETKRNDRKSLLDQWKANQIDLMVATSAFGVGVDKEDVRAVIHACYPENLDRYYQEVGRSGRDGYSSVCLLMPTVGDLKIAKSLGTKLLKDENKIQQRWESMYNNRQSIEGEEYVCKLPVSVKRLSLKGGRTYSKNIIWNKSLLLQMFRSECIELLNLEVEMPEDPEDEQEEWVTVRINFPPGAPNLAKLLEPVRKREMERFKIGFDQIEELISPKYCISRTLQKLYNVPYNQRVCGGCIICRGKNRGRSSCPPLLVAESDVFSNNSRGTIVENWPDPTQITQQDDFIDKFEECLLKQTLNPIQLFCPDRHFEMILKLLGGVFHQYRKPYRIDPFTNETVLLPSENHRPLFLHIGSYLTRVLEKAQNSNPIHFFCGVQTTYGPDGRHIKNNYNCNSWPTPEAWLRQII